MDQVILFNKCCILAKGHTYLFGIYNKIKINKIECNGLNDEIIDCKLIRCVNRPDFCLVLLIEDIDKVTIHINNKITYREIVLEYPFRDIFQNLERHEANIISTMCKNYNHRLDEWIKYNLKLGIDGILIFDNSENTRNPLNEGNDYLADMSNVTDKYGDKVVVIKLPYSSFPGKHWNNIQRISLHIGCTVLKDLCKFIIFIDADEFIHIPNSNNIKYFCERYDRTIQIGSNLLTNKDNNDTINNNILSLCQYIGPSKYNKILLRTSKIGNLYGSTDDIKFVISPHDYKEQLRISKREIIHYHCWVNKRCRYRRNMKYIDLSCFLKT